MDSETPRIKMFVLVHPAALISNHFAKSFSDRKKLKQQKHPRQKPPERNKILINLINSFLKHSVPLSGLQRIRFMIFDL